MASLRSILVGRALKAVLAAALLGCAVPAAAHSVDRWAGDIALASARFGIPAEWIRRVMRVESGGRTMLHGQPIVSSAGAMGLMQLMPSTWRDMRVALRLGVDPNDPRDNILAGAAYLRILYDRFGYPGLFAAYNAGPSRYAAFLSGARRLPAETRAYVASIAHETAPAAVRLHAPVRNLFALASSTVPASPEPAPFRAAESLFVELGYSAGQ